MTLDEDGWEVCCDWCGIERNYRCKRGPSRWFCDCENCEQGKADVEIQSEVWAEFFRQPDGRKFSYWRGLPDEFPQDLCRDCAVQLTPWVQRFADIYEVKLSNSRLERAINGKRKQAREAGNNGPVADHAGQCGQGRHAGAS